MKPADVYGAKFISLSANIDPVSDFLDGIDSWNEGLEQNRRVFVRTHYDPYIDGTRNASLYSVWLAPKDQDIFAEGDVDWTYGNDRQLRKPDSADKMKPVFICKTGGRPDREYYARFITDPQAYGEALGYLKSLEVWEERRDEEVFDINDEIEDLDRVYGTPVTLNEHGEIVAIRR